ncbi:MAG: hypothetical protein QW756_00830 [Nitrososphaerota archaeon]
MLPEDIVRHYSRDDVAQEIARFSRGRWVAIHCAGEVRPVMLRYMPTTHLPIQISSPADVRNVLEELNVLRPRSFYASIHRYVWRDNVPARMVSSMPSWDVDLLTGRWEKVVETAQLMVSLLEKHGVVKSVIVKWSGEGMHVHIHEGAFSPHLIAELGPLNVAYAVTEYVLSRMGGLDRDVRVENKLDPARVFTSPLSLHRTLDRVCVCLDPDRVSEFAPEWSSPENFRHYVGWDAYTAGEADDLAKKAYDTVGPYPIRRPRRRVHPPLDYTIRRLQRRLGW